MYTISEYVVFYLMIDSIGYYEDLKSIGVKDESLQVEKSQSKEMVDSLVALFCAVDKDLRMFDGYATGVGEYGMQMQQFGPILLAYTKNINEESAKSVYSLMAIRLPRILRKMGVNCRFVRGAMVKGFGWDIEVAGCRTLYGPVMNKAWDYLTNKAYSLRIIIEQELFKVLSNRQSYGPGKDGDWLPLYATTDYDGQGIFDYLACDRNSSGVLHDTEEVVIEEMSLTLKAIQRIISNLVGVYYIHDNSKTVRKLWALREYVLKSISLWTKRDKLDILRELDSNINRLYEKIKKLNLN